MNKEPYLKVIDNNVDARVDNDEKKKKKAVKPQKSMEMQEKKKSIVLKTKNI